nr:MAG TPA: hypothetical protein [Inoviridae sp.]
MYENPRAVAARTFSPCLLFFFCLGVAIWGLTSPLGNDCPGYV